MRVLQIVTDPIRDRIEQSSRRLGARLREICPRCDIDTDQADRRELIDALSVKIILSRCAIFNPAILTASLPALPPAEFSRAIQWERKTKNRLDTSRPACRRRLSPARPASIYISRSLADQRRMREINCERIISAWANAYLRGRFSLLGREMSLRTPRAFPSFCSAAATLLLVFVFDFSRWRTSSDTVPTFLDSRGPTLAGNVTIVSRKIALSCRRVHE
jgi:hypothetical protein